MLWSKEEYCNLPFLFSWISFNTTRVGICSNSTAVKISYKMHFLLFCISLDFTLNCCKNPNTQDTYIQRPILFQVTSLRIHCVQSNESKSLGHAPIFRTTIRFWENWQAYSSILIKCGTNFIPPEVFTRLLHFRPSVILAWHGIRGEKKMAPFFVMIVFSEIFLLH